MDWHLLQLADSSLPVGGFVCSNGLEAALQTGNIRNLNTFLIESLTNLANQSFWFITQIDIILQSFKDQNLIIDKLHLIIDKIVQIDNAYESVIVSNHIGKRASMTQVLSINFRESHI
jgi:urease accessory protein UreF